MGDGVTVGTRGAMRELVLRRFLLGLVLGMLLLCGVGRGAIAASLDFDAEEKQWIAEHPSVSVGVVADNEPYSFFRNGQTMGWTVDVLRRLEASTGLSFQLRMGSWPEVFGQFREGGLDVIADISQTDERSRTIEFTDAYHLRRTVLFHNVDRPLSDVGDVAALKGKRIGIIRDIYYADALRQAGLQPVEYGGYRDLMAAVAFGWIDGALAAEMTGNFFARENGFSNVSVAGSLSLAGVELEDFRLGVLRGDGEPEKVLLARILAKAVAALPAEDLAAITERWLSYRSNRNTAVTPLRLLPEEQAFLAQAPPLKVGFMSDYEPFSFLRDGKGEGFAVELVDEISARTGIVFQPVYDTWPNLLERFKAGEIDVVSNMSYTRERAADILFTQEYHSVPNAVFVRSGFGPYRGLESLKGKRIGIGEGIFYADRLRRELPGVVGFRGQEENMQALSRGEVDAAIMALGAGNALVRRFGLINIEIGGEFTMDGVEREDLRFGISPRFPYARSIIDRAISAIPVARWGALETKWLGPSAAGMAPKRIGLTTEERAFLDQKGVINVCPVPSPPFSVLDDDGGFKGVAAGLMALLGEKGGFSWHVVPGGDGGACDVQPFAMDGELAADDWITTEPYLRLPLAVASPLHKPFVDGMRQLAGQRVAVLEGQTPVHLLASRYPDVALIPFGDDLDVLRALRDGEIDAAVGTLAGLGNMITVHGANDMKISGRVAEEWQASIATVPTEPELAGIFAKLVNGLDEGEVQMLLSRQTMLQIQPTIDYTLLYRVAGAAAIMLALFFYWNRKLRALNAALASANEKLQEISVTDRLTGLHNRLHFDARSSTDFALCKRNGWLFSLAMIDVDHFKPVNDEMGHVFGDVCLRHLSALMKAAFQRSGDMVARYGGEEFVILTMGGTAEDFERHLEGLRERIAASSVISGSRSRNLTVSIGCVSIVPTLDDELGDVIARADRRLYAAKGRGRNRLVAGD